MHPPSLRHRAGRSAGDLTVNLRDGAADAGPGTGQGTRGRGLSNGRRRPRGSTTPHWTSRCCSSPQAIRSCSPNRAKPIGPHRIRVRPHFRGHPTRRDRWRRTSGIPKVQPRTGARAGRGTRTVEHLRPYRPAPRHRAGPDPARFGDHRRRPGRPEDRRRNWRCPFGGPKQRRSAKIWLDALAAGRPTLDPPACVRTAERAAPGRALLEQAQTRGGRAARSRAQRTERGVRTRACAHREPGCRGTGPAPVLGLGADNRQRHGGGHRRSGAARRRRRTDLAARVGGAASPSGAGPAARSASSRIREEVRRHLFGASICGQ